MNISTGLHLQMSVTTSFCLSRYATPKNVQVLCVKVKSVAVILNVRVSSLSGGPIANHQHQPKGTAPQETLPKRRSTYLSPCVLRDGPVVVLLQKVAPLIYQGPPVFTKEQLPHAHGRFQLHTLLAFLQLGKICDEGRLLSGQLFNSCLDATKTGCESAEECWQQWCMHERQLLHCLLWLVMKSVS